MVYSSTPTSRVLVPRPRTKGIPETMACRVLMFAHFLARSSECTARASIFAHVLFGSMEVLMTHILRILPWIHDLENTPLPYRVRSMEGNTYFRQTGPTLDYLEVQGFLTGSSTSLCLCSLGPALCPGFYRAKLSKRWGDAPSTESP